MKTIINQNKLPKILLINKPLHWTSNDVIRKIKSKYKLKKVGHCGTLDPLASGLLILGINDGTKLLNNLITDNKSYRAIINFNYCTTTYDNEGEIVEYQYKNISIDEIKEALNHFKNNNYFQTPPKFSAIKINGKKAYELARNSKDVQLNSRLVKLHDYKIISYNNQQVIVDINVSKGFYVRSFAYDIGRYLNNSGMLAGLIRLSVGDYNLIDAYKIEDLDELLN